MSSRKPTSPSRGLRRALGALAAAAIAVPAFAVTTASAEPVYDTPLPAAAGTTWTDGACAEGEGVTVVSDLHGDDDAVARCVTKEDGSPYAAATSLQAFADAGFAVVTQTSAFGPMICQVDAAPAPNPCDAWTGVWWSFWTGTSTGGWVSSGTGAHETAAATDSFVALSLVDNVPDAPAPRVAVELAGGGTGAPTPSEPAPGEEPTEEPAAAPSEAATAAADFLARELQAQDHLIVSFGFPDYGLTTDMALSLASTGLHEADAAAATEQVAAGIGGYVGTGGETYAGATAKALVLALTMGADPTDFGGLDLVAQLQGLETDEGRFSDVSEWGDYSNNLVQSLAIIGLEGAGVGASQAAVDFLVESQCADGGFALEPGGATCVSDPDATSFAVQALLATPCAADASTEAGLAYLLGRQADSGGLGGGTTTEGINANSTGLAGAIFATAGLDEAAAAAVEYLTSMQYGDTFPAALQGAVAYDSTVHATRQAAGPDASVPDQDRRTTVQALIGLSGVTYAELAGAFENAPERECVAAPTTPKPTTPVVAGPIIETDVPGGAGLPLVQLALAGLLVLLAGGGAVVATARRGSHR